MRQSIKSTKSIKSNPGFKYSFYKPLSFFLKFGL
jgi:hypothetical protein